MFDAIGEAIASGASAAWNGTVKAATTAFDFAVEAGKTVGGWIKSASDWFGAPNAYLEAAFGYALTPGQFISILRLGNTMATCQTVSPEACVSLLANNVLAIFDYYSLPIANILREQAFPQRKSKFNRDTRGIGQHFGD